MINETCLPTPPPLPPPPPLQLGKHRLTLYSVHHVSIYLYSRSIFYLFRISMSVNVVAGQLDS